MRALELPTLRARGDIVGIVLEHAELAGERMAVVTTRLSATTAPQRRWHADLAQGLAYAGEQAERHNLPLIDLRVADDA